MIVTVQPSNIGGSIHAPASKSSMQRACAAALLSNGRTVIHRPGHSNDDKAAIELIQQMGATVTFEGKNLVVTSNGIQPLNNTVNCGESGLGIRMFAPIISLSDQEITISGEGSLLRRPMDFFDEVLPKLGVQIRSSNGKLPISVRGPLKPVDIEIDGSLSSQFLTGLLMAYSAAGARNVSITVNNLKSRPYIDLTLDVMRQFGMRVPQNKNYEQFFFNDTGITSDVDKSYTVEGDWSGGAFLLVTGAVAGNILVEGLDVSSTQADKAILGALQQSGASISIEQNRIEIGPPAKKLAAFHFDATECPDLFPPLVALAAYCEGKSVIQGATRLTHKESDRAATLREEFGKMGIRVELQGDTMIIEGGVVTGGKVHSHHDHRIAMACAVAALKAKEETTIDEAQAIKKSYPDFYTDIQRLGASVTVPSSLNERVN